MAFLLRQLSHARIDNAVERETLMDQRSKNFGGSWNTLVRQKTNKKLLYTLCDMLLELDTRVFFTVTSNTVRVYTNDYDLLLQRLDTAGINHSALIVNEISVIGSPGELVLCNRNPHKWRSYFKNYACTPLIKKALVNYLSSQESVKFSPSLCRWSKNHNDFLRRHFFVDYDQSSIIDFIDFIAPVIRKTLPIKTHK